MRKYVFIFVAFIVFDIVATGCTGVNDKQEATADTTVVDSIKKVDTLKVDTLKSNPVSTVKK